MDAAILSRELSRAQIDGDVFDPGHRDYDKYRRTWNATADRRPSVIVRARSVSDVERVVALAARQGALLAVRGGGHSLPGLSTCDDGIVLDLSLMNSVHVDKAAWRAEVQGGALLGDLDRAGAEAGLVVPAGVVSHTGVGGLTLGGGMGWLSRRFGLTIDNLVAVDLVTADGRSRRVSAESDPDLFWAVRGGGGNFGVVTNFTFKMHELGRALVGTWTYPTAEAANVMKRFNDLTQDSPREVTAGIMLSPGELMVIALCSGALAESADALAAFDALGRAESASLGDTTYLELQGMFDDALAWDRRYYMKGLFLQEVDAAAIERMTEGVARAPAAEAEFFVLRLGGAVSDIDEEATPYSGRKAGYYCLMGMAWDDERHDEQSIAWSRSVAGRMTEIAMRRNYINEQTEVGPEIARAAYGEDKYGRLAKLKGRYDPTNLFRLNQNIEPEL